jgi:hypothetical protein
MMYLTAYLHDNCYHPTNYRDDDDKYTSFSGGSVSHTARSEQYNPIPLELVVPRDPVHHKPFELNCTCSGCELYKALKKEAGK